MARTTSIQQHFARARQSGYDYLTNLEKDGRSVRKTYCKNSLRNQDAALQLYTGWRHMLACEEAAEQSLPQPTEDETKARYLHPGADPPDRSSIKSFLRFKACISEGQIDELPTVDALNTFAEWFFAGLTRVTGSIISAEERSEPYTVELYASRLDRKLTTSIYFVRVVLKAEGRVVFRRKLKVNFQVQDLVRCLTTTWSKEAFACQRYRLQYNWIVPEYCWTGARIAAFFTGGLRYRDVELVLKRMTGGPPRYGYQLKQRWVKNNQDPEHIYFGSCSRESQKLIFNNTATLLALALADGAIEGVDTVKDLVDQIVSAGQQVRHIPWREGARDRFILRAADRAGEVTERPMSLSTFRTMHESVMRNAGYTKGFGIQAIRRQLGKKVDERYTEAQRSQHMTYTDTRIFGAAYVANCSSVDGMAAFLGEEPDHEFIEYFQGLDQFVEPGLPTELPSKEVDEIGQDTRMLDLQDRIKHLATGKPSDELAQARRDLVKLRRRLQRERLRSYQQEWMIEERKSQMTTKDKRKGSCEQQDRDDELAALIPELSRLAKTMSSDVVTHERSRGEPCKTWCPF